MVFAVLVDILPLIRTKCLKICGWAKKVTCPRLNARHRLLRRLRHAKQHASVKQHSNKRPKPSRTPSSQRKGPSDSNTSNFLDSVLESLAKVDALSSKVIELEGALKVVQFSHAQALQQIEQLTAEQQQLNADLQQSAAN